MRKSDGQPCSVWLDLEVFLQVLWKRTLLQQCVLDRSWQSLLFGCQMDPCFPHTLALLRPRLFSLFFFFPATKEKRFGWKKTTAEFYGAASFAKLILAIQRTKRMEWQFSAAWPIRFWRKFELADMSATPIFRHSAGNLDKIQNKRGVTKRSSECCSSTAFTI